MPRKKKEEAVEVPEKRYCCSLQKKDDKCCYKDFHNTDTLKDAKSHALTESNKTKRPVIIFDRYLHQIIYREIPEGYEQEKVVVKTEVRKTDRIEATKKIRRR